LSPSIKQLLGQFRIDGQTAMPAMRKLPVVPICRTFARLSDSPETPHGSKRPASSRGAYRDRHER